eukprot:3767280-Lingulodinium_polyedra.AAC.1
MPRHRGSFQIEATRWGEHLTADYIASKSELMLGVDGSKHAFVIRDIFSGLCHAFPTRTRTTEDTVEHFK